MSCYKISIDGMAFDIYAENLLRALYSVAVSHGCYYMSLGTQYYEDGQLCDYRFNDLIYYDQIVSSLRS